MNALRKCTRWDMVRPFFQLQALGGVSDRCSQAEPVRTAVSAGLNSLANEAEAPGILGTDLRGPRGDIGYRIFDTGHHEIY